MATASITKLSGSTDGKGVVVAATAIASGTTIHTAVGSGFDFPVLYAENQNASGVTRTLTLGWGGTTDPDHLIVLSIPPKAGFILVADGNVPIGNSLIIKAAADVANEVVLYGMVRRYV